MHTGNNISVPENELISSAHHHLNRYDELRQASGSIPQYNPYEQPIVYTTEDGRQVQIPEQIHQKAIDLWIANKNQNIGENNNTVDISGVPDMSSVSYEQDYESIKNNQQNNQQNNIYANTNNFDKSQHYSDFSELEEVPDGYQSENSKESQIMNQQESTPRRTLIQPEQTEQTMPSKISQASNILALDESSNHKMYWIILIIAIVGIAYYMKKYNK